MSQSSNGSGSPGPAGRRNGTTTLLRTPVRPKPAAGTPPRVAAVKGRRRPAMVVLTVVLAVVSSLVVVAVVNGAGQRVAVLVMTRDVAYGSVLTDADVGTAQVSRDPAVATISADGLASVIGQVATTDLHTGMLLAPSLVAPLAPPVKGQVLVAIAIPASRMPVGSLAAGDQILVVDTPAADADPSITAPATIPATVVRVGSPDVNGTTVLDVTVAVGDGPELAARSATGRIAVVLEPAGQ